jgi:isoleucyl-tRNA synthetase
VIRGGNLVVTEDGIREGVRQFLLPVWSTYYFLSLYVGDHEPVWRTDSSHVLDRYILAKTRDLIESATVEYDALDSPMAAQAIRDFADVLTNWYVRRSRDRFWEGADTDALDTLYTVLETLCRVAAPLAPLITEEIWRGITGGESVHLTDWPDAHVFPADDALVTAMDHVRDVASAGLGLRKAHSRRVRLPLSTLTIVSEGAKDLEPLSGIIAEELNVSDVVCVPLDDDAIERFGIGRKLIPHARVLGPRVQGAIQGLLASAKTGDWSIESGVVTVGGTELLEGEYALELTSTKADTAVHFLADGGFVLLDTTVSPRQESEGLARDAIRWIQQQRKASGLQVSDRIDLVLHVDADARQALETHRDLVCRETLARSVSFVDIDASGETLPVGNGSQLSVTVSVNNV